MIDVFRPDLLAGKVALVTGGGTGLGYAMAEHFARHGADVVIASRRAEHVEPAAESLRAHGTRIRATTVDVRDPQEVERLMAFTTAELGRLDVLVNNAAGNFLVRAEDLSPNGWRAVVGIVLDGTFHCCRAAFPALRDSGGVILNIVATYAESAGAFVVHSAAAKAGVVSLTRTLALEWAHHGVRVNAISPGPVPTPGAGGKLWDSPEASAAIERAVPLGRMGRADEVATLATFLASDAGAYMTGGIYPVDGGLGLGGNLFDSRFAALMREPD